MSDVNTLNIPGLKQKVLPPVFLLVLCILSFFSSIISIFASLMNILLGKVLFPAIFSSVPEMQEPATQVKEYMNIITSSSVIGLIASFVSAFGVFLMFRLKKVGLIIYITGELLPWHIMYKATEIHAHMIASDPQFVSFPSGISSFTHFFGYLSFWITVFADIVVIVLYAINLKHMNR